MLGLFNPKTDDQIKQDMKKNLDNMILRSASLKKLIISNWSGWAEFRKLISDYMEKCKKRKAITALDTADEKTIYELKLLDHEIYILSWVLRIPEQFIDKTENAVKEFNNKKEE
jgi:hypothetical protein